MKIKLLGIVLLLSVLLGQKVAAWGSTGHRAIALIAYEHLDKKTKLKIEELLGDEFIPYFSNWADEVRSDQGNEYAELRHYVNMPLDVKYDTSDKHPDGDIVVILDQMVSILKDKKATNEKKAEALKIVIHLVGDIHQPMHVGLEEDLGGNLLDVLWFGRPTNLHRLWDEGIIEHSQLSFTELAHFAQINTEQDVVNIDMISFNKCVDETQAITRKIYEDLGDKDYSYAYYRINMPVILEQVNKAGMRLAYLLNNIFK